MTRTRRFLAVGLMALSSACTEHSVGPLSPAGPGLMLRPQYGFAESANLDIRSIDQIRLILRDEASGVVVDSATEAVESNNGTWTPRLTVAVTDPDQRVFATAELIHLGSGAPEVELSGVTEVFALSPNGPIPIVVYPGPLTNLEITALEVVDAPGTMLEGAVAQVHAAATMPAGLTPRVFWSSSDESVLEIDADGAIRARTPGAVRISAYAGRHVATADIAVTARPAQLELSADQVSLDHVGAEAVLTARVLDARGATMPGIAVSWSVADSSVLAHLGNGRFRAVGVGETEIHASIADASIAASASVTVTQAVNSVQVTPGAVVLRARGEQQQLKAVVQDAGGTPIAGAAVTWSSSDPGVATVDAQGLVTAVESGLAVITAESGSASATADVRVDRMPHTVTILEGDAQRADAGTVLEQLPTVRIVDASGASIAGVQVRFAASDSGSVEHAVVTTNADGVAAAGRWTLGPRAGVQTLTAVVVGLEPITFTATANAVETAPAEIVIVSGDDQIAEVGDTLSNIRVRVVDALGRPVSTTVTFVAVSGGGGVIGEGASTDTAGIARLHGWILGTTPGTNTLEARVEGIEAVTFTATALAGAPHTLAIVAGDGQTAEVGAPVPEAPAVRLTDRFGNPLAGVVVTFTVAAGDGSITSASDTTDVDGVATAGVWTLGPTGGTNTLVAQITSGLSVTFTATATPPTPTTPTILLALGEGHTNVGVTFTAPLRVMLSAPAPEGGVSVAVGSGDQSRLTVAAPGHFLIAEGESEIVIELAGVQPGSVLVTATAPGYESAELRILVSLRLISLPLTLNVPYGQTSSLPVQLAEPAPAAGITVTLSSSDSSVVELVTPTVTIAGGAQLASATIRGRLPGPATITATAPGYISGAAAVVSQANLDFTQNTLTINPSFAGQLTLRLQSSGSPIAAPTGGVAVTLRAVDSACVAVASNTVIPAGLTEVTIPVSYGGSASLACTTRVHADASNIVADSVQVTVQPTPNITMVTGIEVGSGLQRVASFFLGASNHGGVTVTLTSGDPGRLLLAPNNSSAGTDTLRLFFPPNTTGGNFYMHAVGDTGAVTVRAEAPGFSSGTMSVGIEQPAIELTSITSGLTTVSPDDVFRVIVGLRNAAGTGLREQQQVRFGESPLLVTVQSDSPSVAQLVTSAGTVAASGTVSIQPGASQSSSTLAAGGIAVRPTGVGTTLLRATAPEVFSTTGATRSVTVSTAVIGVTDFTIGSGLQRRQTVSLGASAHGGVTVHVSSTDPTKLLVASHADSVGSAAIDVFVPNGSTSFNFYTNALEGVTDTVLVTAVADRFEPDSSLVPIVAPAIDLSGLVSTLSVASSADAFTVRIGLGNTNSLLERQPVRPGGQGYAITVASSVSEVADLITSADTAGTVTLQIGPGASATGSSVESGGARVQPRSAGQTTISASARGVVSTAAASVSLTVHDASISLSASSVGAGLQRGQSGSLSGGNHGGVTVRLTSTDTTRLLLAPNNSTLGSGSIDISVADGSSSFSFWTQAMDGVTGSVPVEVSAPGFETTTALVSVVEPALDISGLPTSMITLGNVDPFSVRVGIASGTLSLSETQTRRVGAEPLVATVTSSTPAGLIVTSTTAGGSGTTTIAPAAASSPGTLALGGLGFRPFTAGTTVVSARIPGFKVLNNSNVTVAVAAPSISLTAVTVGAGLQKVVTGHLSAANHGGVTVTVSTSNSSIALVSDNAAQMGGDSAHIFLPDGQTSFQYVVQGIEGAEGTVAIRAAAPGFTDASTTAAIVKPAIELTGVAANLSAGAPPDVFEARVGIVGASSSALSERQQRRAGAEPLVVTVSTSQPEVARLSDGTANGSTILLRITPGTFATPNSLAAGAGRVDPLAPGETTLSASIQGFLQTTAAVRTVTVSAGTDQP